MYFYTDTCRNGREVYDLSKYSGFGIGKEERSEGTYSVINFWGNASGSNSIAFYRSGILRDEEFKRLQDILKQQQQITKQGGKSMMETIKDYFKKNQDTFITLAIIILIDNFIFEGKFREKIKDLMDKLIIKTEKKLLTTEKEQR